MSSYWRALTAPSASAPALKGAALAARAPPAEALPGRTDPVRSRSPFKRRGAGVTRRYKRRRSSGAVTAGARCGGFRPAMEFNVKKLASDAGVFFSRAMQVRRGGSPRQRHCPEAAGREARGIRWPRPRGGRRG